jgi:hydrogenase/urease accessory protein HupE
MSVRCLARGSRRGLLALLWLAFVPAAGAHESRPAYLELTETAPGQYRVLWRTPVLAGMHLPVVLQLPASMKDLSPPAVQELPDSLLERRWVAAGPGGLADQRIEFPGLQLTITDILVRVELLDGRKWTSLVRPAQPWTTIAAAPGKWRTAVDFVKQGIEHILLGPDHLLFVFGLLLLVNSPWMLVKTVTAFTLAHSLTLGMATLGYVQPPGPPIEVAIALSILFLGPEIIRAYHGGTSITIRHPWVVAFAFGLLHGFGFASAMSAAGLPPADLPLALVSFNVGVEIGQLTFVAVVLLLWRALRRLSLEWPAPARLLPAYLVGSLGAFWVLQRLGAMAGFS